MYDERDELVFAAFPKLWERYNMQVVVDVILLVRDALVGQREGLFDAMVISTTFVQEIAR